MPQCLLQFCAHKAGYDVLIERWKQHDYTDHQQAGRERRALHPRGPHRGWPER